MTELATTLSKYGYALIGELSSGAHGSCLLVRKNGVSYILKDYMVDDMKESSHEARVYGALHGSGLGNEFFFTAEKIKLDNKFYLKTQTYEGWTLEQLITSEEQISILDKFNILINSCTAISEMHNVNYIHLDIKPSNLYISKTYAVKPIDMGSAIERTNKSFDEIMNDIGYMSTNEFASKKVRRFNYMRNEYSNFATADNGNITSYLVPEAEKMEFCHLESQINFKDDIYSLICCVFFALTNGMNYKYWIDSENYMDNERDEIRRILKINMIPEYLNERLCTLFMLLNKPYSDTNEEVPFSSVLELKSELETLREIMENRGFHPEVLLRNSARYFKDNFSNVKIDPDLLTDLEEADN